MTAALQTACNWPAWAPADLIDRRERLLSATVGAGFDLETEFQRKYVETIESLCTSADMERAWLEIARHAKRSDYHNDLALEITKALLRKPVCPGLDADVVREKRKRAAKTARDLADLLSELGFEKQSVLPIMGTKTMHAVFVHFTDGLDVTISDDSALWARELNVLAGTMMQNTPGVGSIGDLLERMAARLESKDKTFWPAFRQDDEQSRAKELCRDVGKLIHEVCGTPLYGTVARICDVFFPGCIQVDNARKVLNAAGIAQERG